MHQKVSAVDQSRGGNDQDQGHGSEDGVIQMNPKWRKEEDDKLH